MKLLPHDEFTQLPSFQGFRLLPQSRQGIDENGVRFIESSWASSFVPSEEQLKIMKQEVEKLSLERNQMNRPIEELTTLVTDLLDEENELPVTEHEFLDKVKPFQQRAARESLELTFHVFSDGADGWEDDPHRAFLLYDEWVRRKRPTRLYVELYSDRANDEQEHEDCLLSYKEFPF